MNELNELGFLLGSGALLIEPSRKHHNPWIKPTFINDFLLILKGGGGRIRETEPDWLYRWGGRPHPLGGRSAPRPILPPVCF
jgi:hypothetical protein